MFIPHSNKDSGVAAMFLARFRFLTESLWVHSFHQCACAIAPNSLSFQDKLISKHACGHKRVVPMELVDSAHQCEFILTHRPRPAIGAATAYLEKRCLPAYCELRPTVNYRSALSNPALLSAL
ncbi:hypothetical protein SAMN05660330_04389 [Desulforhopalus singaporensis]|uniref:Uncharacterized protein n=1 Tax=Desulforhopalus singaporensis TaxID=91360 RepID=A0A1H0W2I7_9BACT|nr:hypothetical protein SAMN05660330_04389 [Desulforhopalus singaporensis]